jgi:hypothetical protein
MAREFVPEKQPRQVRMPGELDAHQVVDLALLQVRADPQRRNRRDTRPLVVGRHFHLEDVVLRERGEMVHNIDACDRIDAAQLNQELAIEHFVVADHPHGVEHLVGVQHDESIVHLSHRVRDVRANALRDCLAREICSDSVRHQSHSIARFRHAYA